MLTVDQIRAGRGLLDWSQSDLADRAGLSQTGIARIENGTNKPNTKTLQKILRAFDEGGVEFIGERGVQKKVTEIRTLVGSKGFEEFLNDVYETMAEKGGDFCIFNADPQSWRSLVSDQAFNDYRKKMTSIKEKINGKIILKEGEDMILGGNYAEYRWFPEKQYNDQKSLYSYGDKIAFLDFQENNLLITIVKKEAFAQGFRVIFEFAWQNSTKL